MKGGGERTNAMTQLRKSTNMGKGKNLKLILPIKTKNNNKQGILHSNIAWHSFTDRIVLEIWSKMSKCLSVHGAYYHIQI